MTVYVIGHAPLPSGATTLLTSILTVPSLQLLRDAHVEVKGIAISTQVAPQFFKADIIKLIGNAWIAGTPLNLYVLETYRLMVCAKYAATLALLAVFDAIIFRRNRTGVDLLEILK